MTLNFQHRAKARHPEHLLEHELAMRWRLSERTLKRWRNTGRGPRFLRLGKRIVYRLDDIEAFEKTALQAGGGE